MLGGMPGQDDDHRTASEHEIWSGLYEFLLAEHERRLECASSLGVSPGDLKALMRLLPGHAEPMRALAETWRCDASTVTWIVDRLENRGLVQRQLHPTDRRVKAVALSAEGERLRAQLMDHLLEPPAALRELSDSDLAALRRVSDRLRPVPAPAAPGA
jgi:DNA-binding MarR family transcriptional regulator